MDRSRSIFKYIVIVSLSAILSSCGGGGSGSANPLAPPLSPSSPASPSSLTIAGSVSNVADALIEVSISVDEKSFETSTDSDGKYELTIELDNENTDGMLILSAQGLGNDDYINLRSILGDLESIKTAAGNDDLLTASELFSVNISNLTTAAYGMSHIENGTELPSSVNEMRELSIQIRSEELLMAAAAIDLAIEDAKTGQNLLMPEGMTTLELTTSATALNNFMKSVNQIDESLLVNAKVESFDNPVSVNQQREIGEGKLFIYEPGEYSSAYELYGNGTGRFHGTAGDIFEFDWSGAGNEIIINYPDPVISSELIYCDSNRDGQDEECVNQIVLLGSLLTFVAARDGYEIINIEDSYVSRVVDASDPSSQVGPDEPFDWGHTSGAGRSAKAFHTPIGDMFTDPESDEQWILPIARRIFETEEPFIADDVSIDLMTLSAGSTGYGNLLGDFQWEINPSGHLTLMLGDTSTIEYVQFADFIWGAIERNAEGDVTGLNITQGGKREASTSDLTPGYYTLDWSWMDDYNSRFWIKLNEDGTSQRVSTFDNDNDGVINMLHGEAFILDGDWTNFGLDTMVLNFYRSSNDGQACESQFLENCKVWNRRYWDMFAVDGNRYRMAHEHHFFDYLDDQLTRIYLNSRDWVKVDEAPIKIVYESDPSGGNINELGFSSLESSYRKKPIENAWHDVWVNQDGGDWFWNNAAGQKWLMYEQDGKLMVESAYGIQEIIIRLDEEEEEITALVFRGESYERFNLPSIAQGELDEIGFDTLEGRYEKPPVESASDEAVISRTGNSWSDAIDPEAEWFWVNGDNTRAWPLYNVNGGLVVDFGYDKRLVRIEIDDEGSVIALWAGDDPMEAYQRID